MTVDRVQPLEGIHIIDLSWVWAGPAATRILADLGASVIKIEPPHRPDSVRALVQYQNENWDEYWDYGGYFIEKNLGKRGMTLDLAHPDGKEIFLELVRRADVLVESFSPRVMPQLGLGFDELAQVKPGLVYVSMSGYGHTGPKRNRPAYGAALEGEAGITTTIGYVDGPPVKSGLAYSDPLSGVLAAGAIMDALANQAAEDQPEAVHLDISERDVIIPFVSEYIAGYQLQQGEPRRQGNRNAAYVPQGCFECAEPNSWVAISARSDEEWVALSGAMGRADLADLTYPERQTRMAELETILAEHCRNRDARELMGELQEAGVPAAVVQTGKDLLADQQLRQRSFFGSVDQPGIGVLDYPRFLAATFENFDAIPRKPAPQLDEHTDEVLKELGLSDERIRELYELGVCGHQLESGSRTNLSLPLDLLLEIGAVSHVDPIDGAGSGHANR